MDAIIYIERSRRYVDVDGAQRDDNRPSQDDDEGSPIKKFQRCEPKKEHFRQRKNKQDEMDAITRLARAKT